MITASQIKRKPAVLSRICSYARSLYRKDILVRHTVLELLPTRIPKSEKLYSPPTTQICLTVFTQLSFLYLRIFCMKFRYISKFTRLRPNLLRSRWVLRNSILLTEGNGFVEGCTVVAIAFLLKCVIKPWDSTGHREVGLMFAWEQTSALDLHRSELCSCERCITLNRSV